ncbi:MAG: tetratricopeptide repeat protein [Phycisphaera sp.]|nr:tetratricopeptide repeat protein [Phycisphaera sp.]
MASTFPTGPSVHRTMIGMRRFTRASTVLAVLGSLCLIPLAHAQDESGGEDAPRERVALEVDRQAKQLYDKAIELMQYKQYERGLAMLDTVIRDNQGNILGYRAHMAEGRHFLEQHKYEDALSHFLLLTRLLTPAPGQTQTPEEVELYHESIFNAGLSYYQSGQFAAAFPMFRRLTEVAQKSDWANKAYFYIGMSHYQLKNWNKAIDALSLVGTEVQDTGEKVGRIEIGQRFYAKIADADIPVLWKLGQQVKAKVTVSSGDTEVLVGVPIPGKDSEALTSAPTEIGPPKPNDGVLQMVGGDTLTVTYLDDSTQDGQKGVERSGTVRAVSTGTIGFFLGDFSTPAYLAFPGQPQAIVLCDADLDTSNAAQTYDVTIRSLYKVAAAEAAEEQGKDVLDIFDAQSENKEVWKERDSVTVKLTEQGEGDTIRTGVFTGKVKLAPVGDQAPNTGDDQLQCDELDELEVTYTDQTHIYGDNPRTVSSRIKVSGSVNAGVTADQYVVFEAVLKARKNAVEAEALKGLGEIYKDMGLEDRAAQRADEALKKVDDIILDRDKINSELLQKAFQLKWECEILKDDFDAATATCEAFNRLYPQSVLADQALMALSRALAEKGQYAEAVASYKRVLALQNPVSAAEAQYRIGEVLQKQVEKEYEDEHNSKWTAGGLDTKTARERAMGGAIAAYKATYQAYPESAFAAKALHEVVKYYVDTEDFSQASDLLERVFSDFPDAPFLDEMLLSWAQVAYRMGDTQVAQAKLQQLIFDYPSSQYASEAQKKLAALKAGESE